MMPHIQPGQFWSPTAVNFVQHQLVQVTNFWQQGRQASLHLESHADGSAVLNLKFQLPQSNDSVPPPSPAPTFAPRSTPSFTSCDGLKKVSPSQVRRRERRKAAEKVVSGGATAEEAATVSTSGGAEKVAQREGVAEDPIETVVEETLASEQEAEKTKVIESEFVACTSTVNAAEKVKEWQEMPLPLCHYCCHLGNSAKHPVHFYGVCLCSDSDCSCKCYCDESQFELKKRLFPSGLGSRRAEGAEGRAKAKAVASASPWISHKPCEQDDCCIKCRYDSPCC